MAKPEEHENQAQKNEEFSEKIKINHQDYEDWLITVRFYSFVHYIQCRIAQEGKSTYSHKQRKKQIKNLPNIPIILYKTYRRFEDLSRDVRYDCISVKKSDIEDSKKWLKKAKKNLGFCN